MKTTDKINLMIKLEKGLMKLELEELNLISKVVEKQKEDRLKLLFRGKKNHEAIEKRKRGE